MRNRYVRFFVSSTFDDMKLERDLMQEIFSELETKYAEQDWQIEMIDLRWGISKEAGLDNKTMLICKEELKRCQQLSPKPNFIILLGDRYGWIPLPEVIPVEVYNTLHMTESEQLLFNFWYQLDENDLPRGSYLLKTRGTSHGVYIKYDPSAKKYNVLDYTKKEIWEEDVVKPLAAMFERNHCKLYGSSATEQEIELGALSVEDAQDHVIAYIRHLKNVPENEKKTFQEADKKERIESLENRVRAKLSKENIISSSLKKDAGQEDEPLDYTDYISENYKASFKKKMTKHICAIIDKVILERSKTAEATENQTHIEFALEEASQFIGRKGELDFIDKYLHDMTANYGLWYMAPSGMGKSALLAKVVAQYKDEFTIVCRFCGITELSAKAQSLYSSLDRDIWTLSKPNEKYQEINYERIEDFEWFCLSNRLREISLIKPLLIIVDSLDRVDDNNLLGFSKLKWLDVEERTDIKVIISSTPEVKYRIEQPFLRKITLNNMGDHSMQLLLHQIEMAGRQLKENQKQQLFSVLEESDKSPIFIKLLGRTLFQTPSWEDLSKTPSKLETIIDQYIIQLGKSENHGWPIAWRVLCWLTIVGWGITDSEFLGLLSTDAEYVKHLRDNSSHDLQINTNKKVIPPILWLRLRRDLQPLLRQATSPAGLVLSFFHIQIKEIIVRWIKTRLNDAMEKVYLSAVHLSNYYINQYPNKHALLEGCYCLCFANKHNRISREVFLSHMERNLKYIVNKKAFFPELLMDDFDRAIESTDDIEIKNQLRQIKNQLHGIWRHFSPMDVKMALRNFPMTSPLRVAMELQEDIPYYMKDVLCYKPDSTLYSVHGIGYCPRMSQDGRIIVSIKDNGYIVEIKYVDKAVTKEWTYLSPVIEIQIDDFANYIASRNSKYCHLIDVETKETIFKHIIDKNGWMSLSANGNRLLVGNPTGSADIYNVSNKSTEFTLQGVIHAKLSPSGRYIWSIEKENARLTRYDIDNNKFLPFRLLFDENDNYQIPRDELRIITCSDECCIAGDYLTRHYVNEDGKDWYTTVEISVNINLPRQHPYEYLHHSKCMWIDPIGVCKYLTDDGEVVDVGNIDLRELLCVNGDFTIALSAADGRIYDLQNALNTFRCLKVDNHEFRFKNTFFTLSTSYDGNQMAVSSYGISGPWGMLQQTMLRVENGKFNNWSPIHSNENFFMSLPFNAISPDGKMLAVSAYFTEKIFLVDTKDDHIIWQQKMPRRSNDSSMENAMCMKFTKDGKYLTILTGDNIRVEDGYECDIFVFNVEGHCIQKQYTNYWKGDNHETDFVAYTVLPSHNNRFLFLDDSIYDLISENFLIKAGWHDNQYNIISPSTYDIYGSANDYYLYNNKGFSHCSLVTREFDTNGNNKYLSAISPSGRWHYFISNKKLYAQKWPEGGEFKLLRENIMEIYPALDDRYVYLLDVDYHYILFDTKTCEDLQYATKGKVHRSDYLGIKVCAQGLVVLNSESSELSLFAPDEKYRVNKPAITTFVRRWRLEDKTLQEPTAVCPMCGKLIDFKEFKSCQLKEYDPKVVNGADWDEPSLMNHHCPHCKAELQFTPYIL